MAVREEDNGLEAGLDLLDPRFKADPYPMYARLRSETPVCKVSLPDGRQAWLLTRYEDVQSVLKDHKRFSNRSLLGQAAKLPDVSQQAKETLMLFSATMLGADPPQHTRLRRLVDKAFTPRLVEQLKPYIQEIADNLLNEVETRATMVGERKMDLISDYAVPLPVTVILELLGIPQKDRESVRSWSRAMATFDGSGANAEKIAPEVCAFIDYTKALISEKRRSPQDDLLSNLVLNENGDQRLSDTEFVSMVFVLMFAGHETTVHLVGNGMLALLTHPKEIEKLRANPTLIKGAIEELLRYDGPVEIPRPRLALEDIVIGETLISRGEVVLPVIASADRDEQHFKNPDDVDISRSNNQHVAFGRGVHSCPGEALARVEGQIAISTILRRMPGLRLAVQPKDLEWRPGGFALRGLSALPVEF